MENLSVEKERLTIFISTFLRDLSTHATFNKSVAFAIDRQSSRVDKRAKIGDVRQLDDDAKSRFIALNQEVGDICVCIDPVVAATAKLFITNALERFTHSIGGDVQDVIDLEYLLNLTRFGPGSSKGVKGTHFVEKIHSVITVTEKCLPLLRLSRVVDDYHSLNDKVYNFRYKIEKGSSLSTVPKNKATNRTIATEPLGNMSLQLAAGTYIEGALKAVGIVLSTQQQKNKLLALQGSLDSSLSTIDLKDASDRITLPLIRAIWPTEWYFLFSAIRSEQVSIQLPDGLVDVDLNMMSTMGNGFTFPMMTLTLAALVYASTAKTSQSLRLDSSCTAIYGDDIICRTADFEHVCEVLKSAGLSINSDKSYSVGSFRESCGGDYYMGYNVTPCYIESLDSDAEVYIAINKVLGWASQHNIYPVGTVRYLLGLIELTTEPLYVPEWEQPFSGVLTSQVERRYRKLSIISHHKKLDLKHQSRYIMKCIIGGYVTNDRHSNIVYLPRLLSGRCTYRVVTVNLPTAYSDGGGQTVYYRGPSHLIGTPKLLTGTVASLRTPLQNARIDAFLSAI